MDSLRLSDADREAAMDLLSEQYSVGRLTKDEFDERSDAVWSARTEGDLAPVFVDLPDALQDTSGPLGGTALTSVADSPAPDRVPADRADRGHAPAVRDLRAGALVRPRPLARPSPVARASRAPEMTGL